jgi:hypothetical protein
MSAWSKAWDEIRLVVEVVATLFVWIVAWKTIEDLLDLNEHEEKDSP